ncbi:MAG: hypothetical protein BGO29_03555 [Bacteroidales bacterium 36-12]|mgnify:CR=1 FL=1|nr:MAG: hypothetical protein BGO29_03555 [Bacteroidales bacterium 36-12]
MKSIYLLSVTVICVTIFYSCEPIIEMFFGKNEELTFTRTDYDGDQLRINGYYYHWLGVPYKDESIVQILFLYGNGLVLWGGNPYFKELSIQENEFINGEYKKFAKKHPSVWGLFTIDSTSIQYEMLDGGPFRAMINSGKIINDTTFVILKRKSSYGTYGIKEKTLQDTFRLKPFSPKPDSINKFIK